MTLAAPFARSERYLTPLTATRCVRSERYDVNQLSAWSVTPSLYLNRSNKMSWRTVSKAAPRSKRTSKFTFCSSIFNKISGNNYYSSLYDVVKLPNKAIRVINDVPIMNNITPHYVNLGILKFPDIVKLHSCLFFDIFNDLGPSILTIPLLSEQHNHTARNVSSEQLYTPFYRTNIRKFSPIIIGWYFWNDLPLSIRSRPTEKLF